MALKGTLQADFSEFLTAVFTAETKLKSFEAGAAKVESQLNKVTNSFSGVKIIQDATLAAEAVERLGGASTLTASEQAKLNRTVTEALAKYAALGQEAPAALRQLELDTKRVDDETKRAGVSVINWKSALASAAGAMGVAFSVGAVVSFGKSVFDAASQIGDLSTQMGISTDAAQGFKFAAEQSGSTLDAVGVALTKMNNNLAEGNKSTVGALRQAGLSFADIRAMKPEDAFLAITDAIQKIPDPMVQSDVALKLFGKSAAELLPAIKEGFREVSDAALKMSGVTIKELKAAQDSWSALSTKVTVVTGNFIGDILRAQKFTAQYAQDQMKFGTDYANQMADIAARAAEHTGKIYAPFQAPPPPGIHKTAEELAAIEAASKKAAEAAKRYADVVAEVHAASVPLTEAQKEQVVSLDAIGLSASTVAKYLKVSDAAVSKYLEGLKGAKDVGDTWVKAHDKMLDASEKFIRKQVADWTAGQQKMADASGVALGDQLKALTDYHEKNLQLGMSAGDRTIRQLQVQQQAAIEALTRRFDIEGELYRQAAAEIDAYYGHQVEMAKYAELHAGWEAQQKQIVRVKDAIGDLSQGLAQLSQIAGNSLGAVARDLGTLVGSLDTANKARETFKTGLEAFKDGSAIAGIAGMATGILGIASAAIAAGKAIAGMLDRNKGRDLVTDFADTMGGFDALHIKLLELGESGEALWIKLTQGVGRNNPAQAQAIIGEVADALAEQKRKQDAATVSTEAGAQATIETAAAAVIALDQVSGRLLQNADDWGAWSSTVTGYLQRLADDIRALPMPSVSGASAGTVLAFPRPTPAAASSSGALAASDGSTFHINLTMPDGDVLLRQVVIASKRNGLA